MNKTLIQLQLEALDRYQVVRADLEKMLDDSTNDFVAYHALLNEYWKLRTILEDLTSLIERVK